VKVSKQKHCSHPGLEVGAKERTKKD